MSLGSASPDAKKDRAIGIEYSHLQKNAPAGVFVMPSLESLRVWHGVIFVRKGVYQGGVFKFRVDLPPEYPELDAWPRVTFVVARVFNPLVHEESGALDVRVRIPGPSSIDGQPAPLGVHLIDMSFWFINRNLSKLIAAVYLRAGDDAPSHERAGLTQAGWLPAVETYMVFVDTDAFDGVVRSGVSTAPRREHGSTRGVGVLHHLANYAQAVNGPIMPATRYPRVPL